MKHYQYWNQLSEGTKATISDGLKARGLTRWEFLDLSKHDEDIQVHDLERWKNICEDRNIDPMTVVIDDNNLNYKWVSDNYGFKSNYFPNELLKIKSNEVPYFLTQCRLFKIHFMLKQNHLFLKLINLMAWMESYLIHYLSLIKSELSIFQYCMSAGVYYR